MLRLGIIRFGGCEWKPGSASTGAPSGTNIL
jgi:hypothetical protein